MDSLFFWEVSCSVGRRRRRRRRCAVLRCAALLVSGQACSDRYLHLFWFSCYLLFCFGLGSPRQAPPAGAPPEGPAVAAPGRAPGGPPVGGVLGAEPLEPKRHSRLPSPPTGSSVAWAESGLAPSVPSPGSAMEQLFPGGSEPVPHGRGAPAAGALRSSWRPRAMGEPAGKSVRTDRTDLAWAWPY